MVQKKLTKKSFWELDDKIRENGAKKEYFTDLLGDADYPFYLTARFVCDKCLKEIEYTVSDSSVIECTHCGHKQKREKGLGNQRDYKPK